MNKEKEKISLDQLTPTETERFVDKLESEMGKEGAVFEVASDEAPSPWYKRLMHRINACLKQGNRRMII